MRLTKSTKTQKLIISSLLSLCVVSYPFTAFGKTLNVNSSVTINNSQAIDSGIAI